MTHPRIIWTLAAGFFLALVSMTVMAQVIDAPTGRTDPGVQQAVDDLFSGEQEGAVQQTGWPSIPLPKLTMPKVLMTKMTMPDMSSVLNPVTVGFGKVSAGTKKAWKGTKEMFAFGQSSETNSSGRVSSKPEQSFWKRLFTPTYEESAGPQTVGEWMSQPRIDP